jgi:Xaa-Pro dipeptidase
MSRLRIDNLKKLIGSSGLDALALNPGPSLVYLSGLGFHLMERPTLFLFSPPEPPLIVLPELEKNKVLESNLSMECITYGDDPATWQTAITKACKQLDLDGKVIGVEPNRFRMLEYNFLQQAVPSAVIKSAGVRFDNLRLLKDTAEISSIRQAVKIAEDALLATLPILKPGICESDISAELTIQLLRAGSDPSLAFYPIVAGGPNSANPHSEPGSRKLQRGDMLIIDWGAVYRGYCSDLTRTFAIGKVSDNEMHHVAAAVRDANLAAQRACKPAIAAGQIDDAARELITQAGYGPYFNHRVGHGIGMESHEPPYLFAENQQLLAEGMTFTIEPGIYLPGRGGVRIEDNMVITSSGAECLSNLPRELIILE